MTNKIKAANLTSGMRLVVGFYGDALRITCVRSTSSGTTTIVELSDGTMQYHRNHALVEVRS